MSDIDNAKPLLHWLLARYPDTPKSRAKEWIVAGRVRVNGTVIRRPHQSMPDPGAGLELAGRQASTLDLDGGWQIHPRVELIHLDASLAVVNKGSGLIAVPAPNAELSALSILADFLAGKLRPKDRHILGGTALPSAYRRAELLPVHRIDQYTTGVFCMAANAGARRILIDQFSKHTVGRQYIAFAEGRSPQGKGTWRNWLQPDRDGLRQHVVNSPGKSAGDAVEAITHYEVLAEFPLRDGKSVATKLRLRLETGRKHQIRVQAAHAGLPLIGDRSYNPAWRDRDPEQTGIPFDRQALHAELLDLEHPAQPGKRMQWRRELPRDMRELETVLRTGKW